MVAIIPPWVMPGYRHPIIYPIIRRAKYFIFGRKKASPPRPEPKSNGKGDSIDTPIEIFDETAFDEMSLPIEIIIRVVAETTIVR